jgi:hypothetical protein
MIKLYQGAQSGKLHLEVGGVTLATEGDTCRDSLFRAQGFDLWTEGSLKQAAALIQSRTEKNTVRI